VSDKLISLIRTYVPVAVGWFLTWLATNLGVVLDAESSTGLIVGVTALVTAAYYTLARLLESRWPWLGILLGATKQPAYGGATKQLALDRAIAAVGSEVTTPEVYLAYAKEFEGYLKANIPTRRT
jgi:hypothetical protein